MADVSRLVREFGYPPPWSDLLLLLFNFLDASGQDYRDGKWVARRSAALQRVRRTAELLDLPVGRLG